MDAGSCHIEGTSHKGRHRRNLVSDLFLEILRNVRDRRGIHAVQGSAQRRVLKAHGLQRDIARALPDAQQRTVHGAGAVEPCRAGIGDGLVEIVVSVPLQILAFHIRVMLQAVDNAGHASGQSHFRIGHAVAHGVAGADTHWNARVLAHVHELIDKGHHKPVKVRAGNVFEVAARHDAGLKGQGHGFQIHFHSLGAGFLHLLEDVIIAAAHQNAGFPDAHVLYQLEVILVGPDPRGDLRELEPGIPAQFQSLAVLLAVDKELRLPDDAPGTGQTAHELVQIADLFRRIRVLGLLAVPEGSVRDPYLIGHANGHAAMVEHDPGDRLVVIYIPVQDRVLNILKRIVQILLLKEVRFR